MEFASNGKHYRPSLFNSIFIYASSHEFLGPTPHIRVAGFQIFEKIYTVRIEWWDATKQEKWIGAEVWENKVYFDDCVRGWLSKMRGDYSCNLDMTEYLGL